MQQQEFYEIDYLNEQQRKLIASKDIQTQGTTIIKQQPFEIAVLPYMRSKICNYCLEIKDYELLKCSQCNLFYYCSQSCQKKDWQQIHKKECKIYSEIKKKNYNITSQFIMLLRTYIKNEGKILEDFIVNRDQFPEKNVQFYKESAYMVLKLLGEQMTEDKVENLIILNMQIYLNAFTIQDPMSSYDGFAIGIYQQANYMNHSCIPNCIQIFQNRTMHIKTLRPIKKGEELVISYFDVCKTKEERQKFTQENYLFECKCERCLGEEKPFQIKCPKCKKFNLDGLTRTKCQECSAEVSQEDVQTVERKIKKIQDKIQMDIPYNQKVDLILEARNCIDMTEPQFQSIISNFIIFSIQKEQYRNASIFLKMYVKNFNHWYGQPLPILFAKYNELSKLKFFQDKLLKAEEYTREALKLANKFYGTDINFQELKDLRQRHQDIQHEIMMQKKN